MQRAVEQASRANRLHYSAEEVLRQFRQGTVSPELVKASLSLPDTPARAQIVRNDLLAYSIKHQEFVSSAQVEKTLEILRKDLKLLLTGLESLQSYTTLEALVADFSKNPAIRMALQAVGDVSAIGLYGNLQDSALLLHF